MGAQHMMFIATIMLAAALMGQIYADACSQDSPLLATAVEASPKCFETCPQLCEPLDRLISQFITSGDESELKGSICKVKDEFDCVFEPDIFPECEKVLKMGSSIVSLPMSIDEWQHMKGTCDSPVGVATTALRGSQASEANATTTTEASEAQQESSTAAPEGG